MRGILTQPDASKNSADQAAGKTTNNTMSEITASFTAGDTEGMDICQVLLECLQRITTRYAEGIPQSMADCCTQPLRDCIWNFSAIETDDEREMTIEDYISRCKEGHRKK